jgi:hypothetical protein
MRERPVDQFNNTATTPSRSSPLSDHQRPWRSTILSTCDSNFGKNPVAGDSASACVEVPITGNAKSRIMAVDTNYVVNSRLPSPQANSNIAGCFTIQMLVPGQHYRPPFERSPFFSPVPPSSCSAPNFSPNGARIVHRSPSAANSRWTWPSTSLVSSVFISSLCASPRPLMDNAL